MKVGIVGAGIGGLSAAIALSKAGHSVDLYERSRFKNEAGAAIVIGPNGTRILSTWGFDFVKAKALDFNQIRRLKADTLEIQSVDTFDDTAKKYGHRWLLFHRADLHTGLKALVEIQAQVKIHLGVKVIDVDVEDGTIVLADGRRRQSDLVVIADGVHSEHISKIIGEPAPTYKAPLSIYRFLQPLDKVLARPDVGAFYRDHPSGLTTFYKTAIGRPGHMINSYPCRGGELLYAALIHPSTDKEESVAGWNSPAAYEDLVADSRGFHPAVQAICEGATDVIVYKIMWRDPLQTFTKGKAVLLGDAAHLMLSTHSQGACMAFEDAKALEIIFSDVKSPADVESRLEVYDELRLPRVAAVQTMSNRMMDSPDILISEVRRYYSGRIPGPTAKTFSREYNDFFFLYDVAEEAKKALEE